MQHQPHQVIFAALFCFAVSLNGLFAFVLPLKFTSTEHPDDLEVLTSPKMTELLRRADERRSYGGGEALPPSAIGSSGNRGHRFRNPMDYLTIMDPITACAGVGSRDEPITKLFMLILSPTRKAKQHAENFKAQFLRDLHEERLEQGMEDQRQEWLPEIPQATMEEFTRYTNPDHAFKKAFELMQYFAIGLQQILMDIVLHEGKLLPEFKKLEEGLYQILCEIELSMNVRGIRPDHDILHDAMSHRFRDLKSASRRSLRDYIILREYIKALDFIQQLFAYLKVQENMSAVNNR